MVRQPRTPKKLAQRIDLTYFKRAHPFRRLFWTLAVAVPAVGVLWLLVHQFGGSREIYSGGRLSPSHAILADRCELCHVDRPGRFARQVTDDACLTCHDGPVHTPRQLFTPRCAECHIEHREVPRLAHINDLMCTRCHADLVVKTGSPKVVSVVTGFNRNHPEFAPLRPEGGDPGVLKLNHEVHLKRDLKGPAGPVQMVCADCHRPPAIRESWPYGEARMLTVFVSEKQGEDPLAPEPVTAYMAPVEYAKHCAACHPLAFDERFPESVPHDKPDVVRAFVLKKFDEYIARHSEELRQDRSGERQLPGEPVVVGHRVLTRQQWIGEQVAKAERILWHKTCKECHTLNFSGGALPEVRPPNQPVRWLPRAVFDHEVHRLLDCTSCHARVATSKETADVILPGIETCRQCHRPEGAEARCFECHQYHDWRQRKRVEGRFTLEQLLKGAEVPEPSRPVSNQPLENEP